MTNDIVILDGARTAIGTFGLSAHSAAVSPVSRLLIWPPTLPPKP